MRNVNTGLVTIAASFATSLAAQEPPERPRTPQPAQPARVVEPVIAPAIPGAPAPMPGAAAVAMPGQRPEPAFLPIAPVAPELAITVDEFFELQGRPGRAPVAVPPVDQGRLSDLAREMARIEAEMAREQGRVSSELAREQARVQSEMAREQARIASEMAREHTRVQADMAREQALHQAQQAVTWRDAPWPAPMPGMSGSWSERPPAPWAQRDPADSAYRAAYETMNRGDYRKAAALFKEIPQKYQYSAYAADAMYWAAHALYRTGTTPDLQEALQLLEQLKQRYPNTRLRNSQSDVAALQVRIAGVLNSRGQGGSDIVRRALAQQSEVCDREEQQVRAAALNALMQTDPTAASEFAQRMLSQKDDCSRELRRSAVFLIGSKADPAAARTLITVAKTDPAIDVRSSAVQYLGRIPGDEAIAALEEIARADTVQQIQREAIRQLARSASPRARTGIKALVERNDVAENLRITALDALDPERSTQEDVAWLQALYGKVDSPRIRSRIISAMARIGGAQNERWFVQLANNENESIDVRVEALRRAGASMDIAALGRLYDQTGQRNLRYELIRQLENRREPEAVDKIGDIAKNGTDVEVRRRAVEALSNKAKTDPRASRLLLQLIDRP